MTANSIEPVRVAFVGLGNWSKILASALAKSDKLVCASCFARTPEARQAFSKTWGCKEATSYDQILGDSEIEGVIVVAPDNAHANLTVQAARAGKHIFCEKPITNSIQQAYRMMEACQQAGVVLSVAHFQRRMGAIRKMAAMRLAGNLGEVIQAEASYGVPTGQALTRQNWRFFHDEFPGGCMMGLGIHHADNLQYLMGPVRRVTAMCKRRSTPAEITDVGGAILDFESGAIGYLGSNYVAQPNWNFSLLGTKGNLNLRLAITRRSREEYLSMLEWPDRVAELTFHPEGGGPGPLDFEKKNSILAELEEFADCVRLKREPEVGAQEGLVALAVILAINLSAAEGRIVEVKEILESGT